MLLFILFIAIPIIEITLFIELGGRLGLWPTLAIVVATAAIGSNAIRAQGRQMMQALATSRVSELSDLMSQGLLLFLAGAFLLTPGFLTDAIGLLLLVPPIRRYVRDIALRNMTVSVAGASFDPRRAQTQEDPREAHRPAATAHHTPNSRRHTSSVDPSPWRHPDGRDGPEDATIIEEQGPKG